MSPLISIIVPVYQVEDFVANTINSIINQTFSSFEVVLVNDGSKDKSVEIARELLVSAKVSHKIINQENLGIAAARNTGIRNSTGKWILMVDSDDVIAPNLLIRSYEVSLKYNIGVVFCNFQYVRLNNIFKKSSIENEESIIWQDKILFFFLKRRIKLIFPGLLIRKDIIEANNLWFNESMKYNSEQYFIWKLLLITNKVVFIKDKLYNYLVRGGNSIMASADTNAVMSGFNAMKNLQAEIKGHQTIKRYILPRWVFGALKSSAGRMDFKNYFELAKRISYKSYLKYLIIFPDPFISVLSVIMAINLRLFYKICRLF
jgi:glycosyltransferase involved in cell wall biosynthesis